MQIFNTCTLFFLRFIHLFLVALGLFLLAAHGLSLVNSKQGLLFTSVPGVHIVVGFSVAELRL